MGVSFQRHAPTSLYTRGKVPRTHWIGGWVGLRVGLDTEGREKIICLCWDQIPFIQSVVRLYTDWASPATNEVYKSDKYFVVIQHRENMAR
jgi:hypothetical protein